MKRLLYVIGGLLAMSGAALAQSTAITGSVVADPLRPGMYIAEWTLPPGTDRWTFQRCHDDETDCELLAAGQRELHARAELFNPRIGSVYLVTAFRGASFLESEIGVSSTSWSLLPHIQR